MSQYNDQKRISDKAWMESVMGQITGLREDAGMFKRAADAIADFSDFKVGDKLLFKGKPSSVNSVGIYAQDVTGKNVSKSYDSVQKAIEDIDNGKMFRGVLEVYFGSNPIPLLNIESDGKIHRHQLADTMIAMVKKQEDDNGDPLAVEKWKLHGEQQAPAKKSLFDW